MNEGGVGPVRSHSPHDAQSADVTADAYVLMPTMRAACCSQLTNFDFSRFLHWQHSIQNEPTYLNPFDAVMSAWKLNWSVISNHFQCAFGLITTESDPAGISTGTRGTDVPPCPQISVTRSKLHRSCFRTDCVSKSKAKCVQFCSAVNVHIGLEDEMYMPYTVMSLHDLANWSEKPWTKRSTKRAQQATDVLDHGRQLRTTDAFHDVPSRWFVHHEAAPTEDQEDPDDANHFLHEAPESIQILYDDLFATGVVQGPRIHDSVFLRSWYIHHLHAPQCFQSRVIEINGHWRLWFQDIMNAWRDRILPMEQTIFDIVQPAPPRPNEVHEITFDIIIAQGIEAPRRAGLVSVCHADNPARHLIFSVAVSLSEQTSGHQVVQMAEYLHECNLHQCTVRHGGAILPFTLEPVHAMQDGDSFIVTARSAVVANTAVDTAMDEFDLSDHVPNANGDDASVEMHSSVPSPSFAAEETGLRSTVLHRLEPFQTVGQLCNDDDMGALDSGCRKGPVDKGADLDGDIDVPMMSSRPTSRAARPTRPVHDGTETWFWELSQIFQSHSEEEAFEGEFFIYIQTWFIDHERHSVCRRPRPVRLDQHWITWLDDLRHEWRDILAHDAPFSVHIIKPRPPQFRHHGYACHLLLEQNRPRGNAAGILTSLIEGPTNDGITQGAFSVPRFLRKQDIIDFLEVEPFCSGRRCTAYHDQVPIQLVQATEVHSGFSICLRIASQELQRPYAPHDRPQFFEDLDLMQRSITIHGPQNRAIDIPNEAETNCDPFVPPFQFNAHAAAFQPAPPILRAQSEFTQDLHLLWSASASSWENEVPAAHVLTWFVDHRQVPPICLDSRQVTLHDNVQEWETIIKNAWHDSLDNTQPIELYVVQPDPPMMEPSIFAHVVLVQAPRDNWVSNLVTVFDSFISSRERNLMRLVVTTHEHFSLHNIALACGYGFIGSAPIDPVAFQGWVNRHPLEPGRLWPGRSGSEITLQVQRQVVPLPAHLQPQDAQFLLQTHSVRKIPGSKMTDSSLTDGDSLNSQDRIVIDLDAVLFSPHLVPVQLIHASDCDMPAHFPDHVLVPDGFHAADIEKALDEFGLSYHAYVLHATGFSFVSPICWSAKLDCWHLIYFPLQFGGKEEIVLHKSDHEPTTHEHMKFLHAIGFTRAVILDTQQPRCRVLLVRYHNNTPALEEMKKVQKTATAWPQPQTVRSHAAMYRQPTAQDGPIDHLLTWNVTFEDLHDLFHSGNDILCPWHSHLDLPEIVRNALLADASHEGHVESFSTFDRLIVYTDGSSKSQHRRKAPLWVQEFDSPDAWAFVVLGERYGTQSTDPELVLLGWHSQQVLYEPHLPHFLGTDAIGSEFAEREALFWAGIWRAWD